MYSSHEFDAREHAGLCSIPFCDERFNDGERIYRSFLNLSSQNGIVESSHSYCVGRSAVEAGE